MRTYKNIYYKIYSWENMVLAFKKARKGKTKKDYVKKFEENILDNLEQLQFELMSETYKPKPLVNFVIRDPKTRKISKSDFRDRIVHHALINIIQPIFEKTFIYDSCANQKGKGTLFALERFDNFKRKVTHNLNKEAFCLKADIKHYFQEVNQGILLKVLRKKIKDERAMTLIKKILANTPEKISDRGMPLGNLTSQFFANVYLNELDYFIKHELKCKYYLRYVDDFILLDESRELLIYWKNSIKHFLLNKLMLDLHPQKTNIFSLSRGVDFVGFRIFYHHRLLRKRNIKSIKKIVRKYLGQEISSTRFLESFQGWKAYAMWSNSHNLKKKVISTLAPFEGVINC